MRWISSRCLSRAALSITELAGDRGSKSHGKVSRGLPPPLQGEHPTHLGPAWSLVWDTMGGCGQRRSGVGGSLTACSQGQASGTASNEVVQGVVGLLSDLGAQAGGKAKYGSDGSCWGAGGG